MNINSGADWYTDAGNRRSYSVGFDLGDLVLKLGEEVVEAMSFDERIRALNNLADAYAVAYIAKEGGVTQEFARKRLEELSK